MVFENNTTRITHAVLPDISCSESRFFFFVMLPKRFILKVYVEYNFSYHKIPLLHTVASLNACRSSTPISIWCFYAALNIFPIMSEAFRFSRVFSARATLAKTFSQQTLSGIAMNCTINFLLYGMTITLDGRRWWEFLVLYC